MEYALRFLSLSIVWSGLEPNDLTITACRNWIEQALIYIFSHRGLLCASFDELIGVTVYKLKQRLAVQLISRC